MNGDPSGPVRIFSDLHLAHRASRIGLVADLRPLLEGAATVVFNGDTWQELTRAQRERSRAMLDELTALCQACGCRPVFLPGNHDPGWSGPGWLELAGGRVLVTHGDGLLFSGSPWKREILANGGKVRELWERHPAAGTDPGERLRLARAIARALPTRHPASGRGLLRRVLDAAFPPQRALRILDAWWNQGSEGAKFCERYFPAAEVLVIGHFHRAGVWRRPGRLVINTGSFVSPGRAHWVEWHHGFLKRGRVDEQAGGHRLGAPLDLWRLP